jgi:phospholipid/cholesterol/gamma-HCH transport system ATP-binding protein
VTSDAADAVIEVEDLVASYGARPILRGVSLRVVAGEILVIMGGSGSGKSTLLRHLVGLEHPRGGRVRLLGCDLAQTHGRPRDELLRQIGVAFQGGALFSSMTVGENVRMPLREHTALDPKTIDIIARLKLEVVNLSGFEALMPAELSGGMVKRAALARAIVMDPRILFCDEPSAGLDPVVSSGLDDLILRLRDALGMTVVIVTHEIESALRVADRIAVLDRGELLRVGSVEEIRNSDHPRIRKLMNRESEEVELDPERYLDLLTEPAAPRRTA